MPATATPKQTADSATNSGNGWKSELHDVPVGSIEPGANVREKVGDIVELIASVKAVGVLSPILVADIGAGQYELVFGQRRLAASKAAGLASIPAVVLGAAPSREDRVVDQLVENLQRADLNALDLAKAYRWLLDKGLTQRALGEKLGLAQPTIANRLRILKAPEPVQKLVEKGDLTRSHVESIAALSDKEQAEVARRIVKHKLSTRQVEDEIKLAAERQQRADTERDQAKEQIPKIEAELVAANADKGSITLVCRTEAVRDLLRAAGWTVAETPSRIDYLYGGEIKADPCAVREVRAWLGSTFGPEVSSVCIDSEHAKARNERQQKAREAENRKWERERQKRQETIEAERVAAAAEAEKGAAVVAAVLGSAPAVDRWRILLAAWINENQWAFDALVERRWFIESEDEENVLGAVDDPVWTVVSELDEATALAELALLVKHDLTDGAQKRVDELAALATPNAGTPAEARARADTKRAAKKAAKATS